MRKTRVVNRRIDDYDVYVGRPTIYGNPYALGTGPHADVPMKGRLRAIENYRVLFAKRIAVSKLFRDSVHQLRGKILGCWCKPLPCHADVIAEYLNGLPAEESAP